MEQLTAQNASVTMDQETYRSQFEHLSDCYTKINEQQKALEQTIQDTQYRKTKTDMFLEALTKQDQVITEFSPDLWHSLADHATVYSKEDIRFTFKNGIEITV
jgi:hypothetical protein